MSDKKMLPGKSPDLGGNNFQSMNIYKNQVETLTKDIRELAKEIQNLGIDDEEETDTGLKFPDKFNWTQELHRTMTFSSYIVANVRGSYVADDMTKYVIEYEETPVQMVVILSPMSTLKGDAVKVGDRVGLDLRDKNIRVLLPPNISAFVHAVEITEKPEQTFDDIGGCDKQIRLLKEVYIPSLKQDVGCLKLGVNPPKSCILFGEPGTGKTLCARAVANATNATFIRLVGTQLVQRYIGQGAKLVRDVFDYAKTKKACIIFIDEIDAVGGSRVGDSLNNSDVQRTMIELLNQLDGFDPRGNVKVMMATNRIETLDEALLRPGRLDRKIEFGRPDRESRIAIFKIHSRNMSINTEIRFDILARKCQNMSAADIRSVCTEAGMFALRGRQKWVTEKNFIDASQKVLDKVRLSKLNVSYN